VKFNCPQCQKTLNVKDELAGKKGKCPFCGQAITVPDAEIKILDDPGERTDAPRAEQGRDDLEPAWARGVDKLPPARGRFTRGTVRLKIGAAVVVVAAIATGGLWYLSRPSWEEQNKGKIEEMASAAEKLYQSGEYEKAGVAYKKLLDFIGDRDLSGGGIQSVVADARAQMKEAETEIRQKRLAGERRRAEEERFRGALIAKLRTLQPLCGILLPVKDDKGEITALFGRRLLQIGTSGKMRPWISKFEEKVVGFDVDSQRFIIGLVALMPVPVSYTHLTLPTSDLV